MRISDWSSDVCSSDLLLDHHLGLLDGGDVDEAAVQRHGALAFLLGLAHGLQDALGLVDLGLGGAVDLVGELDLARVRSEEHTSELPSLMRISYAVFCLTKKKKA